MPAWQSPRGGKRDKTMNILNNIILRSTNFKLLSQNEGKNQLNDCDLFKIRNFCNGWPHWCLAPAAITPSKATEPNAMEWPWNWLGIGCTLTGVRYEILCQGLDKRKVAWSLCHSLTDVQRTTGILLVKTSAKCGRNQMPTLFAWPCHPPAFSRTLKWKPSFRKEDFRISRISRIMWPPNQLHFP
jgi:hypothetical protein